MRLKIRSANEVWGSMGCSEKNMSQVEYRSGEYAAVQVEDTGEETKKTVIYPTVGKFE